MNERSTDRVLLMLSAFEDAVHLDLVDAYIPRVISNLNYAAGFNPTWVAVDDEDSIVMPAEIDVSSRRINGRLVLGQQDACIHLSCWAERPRWAPPDGCAVVSAQPTARSGRSRPAPTGRLQIQTRQHPDNRSEAIEAFPSDGGPPRERRTVYQAGRVPVTVSMRSATKPSSLAA